MKMLVADDSKTMRTILKNMWKQWVHMLWKQEMVRKDWKSCNLSHTTRYGAYRWEHARNECWILSVQSVLIRPIKNCH